MDKQEIMKDFKGKLFNLVAKTENLVIVGHYSPDEDSIASMLAMYELIKKDFADKKVRMICEGERIERFSFLKNYNQIDFVDNLAETVTKESLMILVDAGDYARVTQWPDKLREKCPMSVCIDHHPAKKLEMELSLVLPEMPAATELIYRCFFVDREIDKDLAATLLMGILGDTGDLIYLKPEQSQTFEVVGKLVKDCDMGLEELQNKYKKISKKILFLVGELIKNTEYFSIDNWPKLQLSHIDEDFQKEHQVNDNQMSEASHIYMNHYLRLIENHPWGMVITPRNNQETQVSLRSLPDQVNVREIVEKMGIGGGHDLAAGGSFEKGVGIREAQEIILAYLKNKK